VNGLDLVLLALALAAVVGGFRLGFVTRLTSWVGMALGVVAGVASLPWIIDHLDGRFSRPDLVLVSAGAVLAGGLVGQTAGLLIGSRLHVAIRRGPGRKVDAGFGAVAGLAGLAAVVWLLTPAMADVPDWPAQQARGSAVVAAVGRAFPPPPDTSRSLRRILGERYPEVFDALDPAPNPGPAPAVSGLDAATSARVAASTVKVEGLACDRIQEGTGFVVGNSLVATNAHVVAGEDRTQVQTSDGSLHRGRVVAFDPDRDLALISVPGLGRPALPLGRGAAGDRGAVFGHPGGGPLRLAPFTVGQAIDASGSDIYDEPGVGRRVLVLAAELRPGDSGSAVVSPDGTVIGVAFAIAPDRPKVAYALATSELEAVLAAPHRAPVEAGACIA